MNKELNRKLEEIAFRLQRLTDDYHDLLKEITELDNVEESKRILYEQYIVSGEMTIQYFIKSRINENTKIINHVKSHYKFFVKGKYEFYGIRCFYLSHNTSKVIETYIPSKNIVLVVEL